MKIGFLSAWNVGTSVGGIENHIYFLTRELNKQGHEIIIYQPVESETGDSDVKTSEGITLKYIPISTTALIKYLDRFNGIRIIGLATAFLNKAKYVFHSRKIADAIRKDMCDLIHQHDFISNIFTTKILAKDTHCVLTNHTGEYLFFMKTVIGRMLLKYLLQHYSFMIGPSIELTPKAFTRESATIYNGVDLDLFNTSYDKNALRKEKNIAPEDFVIFCPRRWAPTKGVIFLMKAIKKGRFQNNFKFIFAGNDYQGYPKYKEHILKVCASIENKSSILLAGNLSIQEMAKYYRISDLTVIPSIMEAVSLAAIESMASGTPVIATHVGGMPELIVHERNGLLIEPKNTDALIHAIKSLYHDKTLYDKLALNSLKTAQQYSWKEVALKTEEIYTLVLNFNKKSK